MTEYLIPEFNQKLNDYRSYFVNESRQFSTSIKVSTERFTEQDRRDFNDLLEQIREFAMGKLLEFINTRIQTKSTSFTGFFQTFQDNAENLSRHLDNFSVDLQEASRQLKQKEIEGENLLERITTKYAEMEALKKGFRAFKSNAQENLKQKKLQQRTKERYEKKLMQKCFFPWRALTYKDGYQNSVKRQTQVQIRKIHTQFGSILDILKQKILETQELIKTKRAAKGEFAYALSKNLLKTISNLSLEVMSLNQVASKDKESESQTQNFLNEVNKVINTRLQSVNLYKQALCENSQVVNRHRVVQIQEPREAPNRIVSPKQRTGKRISFA